MTNHHISAFHRKNLAFEAKIDDFSLTMDAPEDGHPGTGPGPKKLMLAALAGCTGVDVVSILEKMRVPFSDFSISIDASLTEDHHKIYDKVTIVYAIKINKNDRDKMDRAFTLSKEKYCGVSAMFSHFASIDWKINYL